MFYQLIKAVTKHHYVFTDTIIVNDPKIVITNDNDFPEIVNRLITFGLNEEVKIEDVLFSTFNQETISNEKDGGSKEEDCYFSVKNLIKFESTKQIALKMGKVVIFDINSFESQCLMKLNKDLQRIHEDLRSVSIKNYFRQFSQSLSPNDLWSLFADVDFFEKLLNVEKVSEEKVRKEVHSMVWQIFIECLKQKVEVIIKNAHKDEILYFTDNSQYITLNITDPKFKKYTLHMNTDFWPHIEEFLQKEYKNNEFIFLENGEKGKAFVSRIINSISNGIFDRHGVQITVKKHYISSIMNRRKIKLTTHIKGIFKSIDLIELFDTFQNNYNILVNNIFGTLRVSSKAYLSIQNSKDFKTKIEEYKNISQQIPNEEIKNAINNVEKCLESYLKSYKSFEEETRIFNSLEKESIVFNLKIIFRDTNDKIQTIFSKYYFVEEESLRETNEISSIPSPESTEILKKKTGILN